MASPDLTDAFSRITLTKVHQNGFGFAKDAAGKGVFVGNKFVQDIQRGNSMACLGKNKKGLYVKSLKSKSGGKNVKSTNQKWGEWQIGKNQVPLPSTEIGLHHFDVCLQCWKCGTDVVTAAEIYKINNGAVWTNTDILKNVEEGTNAFQNKHKKTTSGVGVMTTNMKCKNCDQDIGALFQEYVDDDTQSPEGPFPRCKITVCREQKKTGEYINQTVLKSSSRIEAERIVNFLNPNNRPTIAPRKNDAMTYYAQQHQAEEQSTSLSWKHRPARTFQHGNNEKGYVYEVRPDMIHDGVHCKEQTEFNFAAQQLIRLTGRENSKMSISSIEVYKSPYVESNWRRKREEFATLFNLDSKHVETVWVFHGTGNGVDKKICETGFRVAKGSQVLNGTAHGNGVYTAVGPDTPITYSSRGQGSTVILSQALIGREGRGGDSWKPRGDWIVFKDAAQLLPKYIIHYD